MGDEKSEKRPKREAAGKKRVLDATPEEDKKPAKKKAKTVKTDDKKGAVKGAKKTTPKNGGAVKAEPRGSPEKAGSSAPKKAKELTKADRLEEARKAFKWWEAEEYPGGENWRYMEHAGIIFPDEYVKHNKPLIYDGEPIILSGELEEIATFYAAMPEDGPQLGGPSRETFQKNFFKDFKDALGEASRSRCSRNVTSVRFKHLDLQKSLKKAATTEEKEIVKAGKTKNALAKGYAIVDGRLGRWAISTWSLLVCFGVVSTL